jgi:Holliday junction resolvase RusA-like endonuclease
MFIFEIQGTPIPQKQTKFFRRANFVGTYDPCSKQKEQIQWQSKPFAPTQPLCCPVKLDLTFYFPVPKSTSSVRRRQMLNHVIHHIVRPDADNCAYLITNALKKIFYQDDSQIIDLHIHKRYGEFPKTVVVITPIEGIAPTQGEKCD